MKISQTLGKFEEYMKGRGMADHSIKSYLQQVNVFVKEIGDLKIRKIKREHIIEWTEILTRRSGNGYITNCLWSMRLYLKFVKERLEVKTYNFEGYIIPKRKRPEYVEFLDNREVYNILKDIDLTDIHGLRLRTLLEVLLNTGMRPSEALSLMKDDPDKRELQIIGKGKKKRLIYFNKRCLDWVHKYLKARTDSEPYLFVTHCLEKKLSLRQAEWTMQKHMKKINFPRHITLHTCRHTYATNLLENGVQTEYIMPLLGHSKAETTKMYYLSIRQKKAKEMHYKYLDYRVVDK